jgi:sialate O-acetylesterase
MLARRIWLNPQSRFWLVLFVVLCAAPAAHADIRLHRVFSNHMVLQRDMNVSVWGWADAGENVRVQFDGQSLSAVADKEGKWSVKLAPMKADATPQNLAVTGKNRIELTDIVVGDVWLCSGQSNMAFGLGGCNAPEDIKSADYPAIRFRGYWGSWSGRLMDDLQEKPWYRVASEEDLAKLKSWKRIVPDGKEIGDCPAVGFYFARKVYRETGVPIGILEAAIGGSSIEAWMPPNAFADFPAVAYLAKQRQEAIQNWHRKTIADMEKWVAEARKNLADGRDVSDPPSVAPHPNENFRGRCEVSCLYNGMINPLTPFGIKGVLWYQGENNGSEEQAYVDKLSAMVGSWRKLWGYEFPFYYVQLPILDKPNEDPSGGKVGWQANRMGMLQALKAIRNSGMAVTIDVGEAGDIHPKNKYDVGERLALWALARDYGRTGLVCSGPLYKAMAIEGGKIRVSFDFVGGGLMVGRKTGREAVVADKGTSLKRFAIAGAERKWVWADAAIDDGSVVVSSPQVPKPVAVLYAFSMNPDGCNLYNREGLPASPFRTDNW